MPRLIQFEVSGLLGQFDHLIKFSQDWDFVILHGPNGVGKTKLLEMLKAISTGETVALRRIPFARATLVFADQTVMVVTRTGQPMLPGSGKDEDEEQSSVGITFHLTGPDNVDESWEVINTDPDWSHRSLRHIELDLGLRRIGPKDWRVHRTGAVLQAEELLRKYPFLERHIGALDPPPPAIKGFFETFLVHLIETQRLLTIDTDGKSRDQPGRASTVEEYARDLTDRLNEALAHNSRRSQELDSTFPRRLLSAQPLADSVTDEEIRRRYASLVSLRTRLAEISVLDGIPDLPLPAQKLAEWQRRVLWTYLEDSEMKLTTFQAMLDRVSLFREIVNARFLYKELRIDPHKGLSFLTDAGRELRPEHLSSGEQHELVLAYELLFKVPSGSLVLIDEPEISLHVGWQQEFMNDIARIADINPLTFVVATHSPQIIHKWWDRTVALTPYVHPGEVLA